MSESLAALGGSLAWPLAVALAWVVGEAGHRWTGLPRISLYGMVGFVLSGAQLGLLTEPSDGTLLLVASAAFGLILFEFGYRVNLRWLRTNPWIGATGLLEAATTFVAVGTVAWLAGMPTLSSLLLASLAMSTSPAALMRVVNEERSSGQVTERVLHLAALNCVLAVLAFKLIVGVWVFDTSGNVWRALSSSVLVLAVSAGLGVAFGVAVPALLRRFGRTGPDATVAIAIGVIVLVAVAHAFRFSPVVAALAFGLTARHRRVALNQAQRNFGALGDLLTVVLFVYVATTIDWQRAWAGLGLAFAIIAVRLLSKTLVVGTLAHVSGTTWRKGFLTGVALTPIAVFAVLMLEQTRFLGVDLIDQLAPLAAMTLVLELIGPVVAQRALVLAGESADDREVH
ncbi:cation:proton antiporter [Piscinibacter koreensis]|uniref:Cation:proton antiporter n=1 Tax=Piscinibacter koreensis TaxID=2742824 RepID=A0A7Y6NLB8_9BURK|nr:cation:proton antiporter [Schlegelella koreensis]NUZ05277.1 cation:proton antiporter [Schlegelella koreensis]